MLEKMVEKLKDPRYLALLVVLAGSTYLRFRYAFFDGLWVDEGRYARIGAEISSHLIDYSVAKTWHGHITKFPPLYPYLIAFSTYIFGKTDFAVRIVSPLMGVLGVGLTYVLGEKMENRDIGLIAAALVAVNPIFWFLSERILVGATFATVYTAAIIALYYGLEDREYSRYALWSLGPLVALNIMTKQPAYTLGLVIPVYFIYRKRDAFREFIVEGVDFRDSKLYDVLTDRDYYVTAGLGFITLLPWMLRNYAVCSFPLCGLSRAAKFANVSSPPAWASTGGPFYYITNAPAIITAGVGLLVLVRIGQYLLEFSERDADMAIKYSAVTLGALGASYFLAPGLVPMVLLTSVALFATSDTEKLLWLWTGIGVGFMSIPGIKVPRYVVFVLPAVLTVASISLYRVSDWLAYQLQSEQVTPVRVATLILLPLLFMSYAQGMGNIAKGGYAQLEPAGEWLDRNAPADTNIASTSDPQMRYYVYPRMAYTLPNNESKFQEFLVEKNISYVEVDVYERAQAKWVQTGIPPYRLPVSLVNDIRSGKVSPQKVVESYGRAPDYLEPVKSFGKTRVPLLKNRQQPMVMIYRVNMTG
ncbi:MAG: ArnT family glycosyltransferase [Candidatus Nanohaloarchaea archaeon]